MSIIGTFGITRARQQLGFTPSTAVGGKITVPNLDTGAAIGQSLLQVGELARQYDIQQANIELSEFQNLANNEMNELKIRRKGNLDPDTYQADFEKTLKGMQSNVPKRKRSAAASNLWLNRKTPNWQLDTDNARLTRSDDNWIAQLAGQIAGQDGSLEKLAETEKMIARRQLGPNPLDKSKAAKLLNEVRQAQAKVAVGNVIGGGFGVWEGTRTEENPDGDLNQALDFINASGIPEGEKQEAESELKTRVQNRRAEDKFIAERADAESVETINGWINNDELAGITERIKELPLTETRKAEEVKRVKNYIRTINSYKANVITSNETIIGARNIISDIKNGDLDVNEGIEAYTELAKTEDINTTDGKSFIADIFRAGESAKDDTSRRRNSILKSRERQLRDSIEKQPNFLAPAESDEILKDFANIAVIELTDKFREGEFTGQDVQVETDRLIRKYTLSSGQLLRAQVARQSKLAETLKEQQKSIKSIIESLRSEGNRAEAKEVLDEAVSLGIFSIDKDGNIIDTGQKKEVKQGIFKKLMERFNPFD